MILLEPLMELKFNDPEIVMMSLLAGDRKWKKQKGGKKSSTHTLKKVLVFNFALHSLRQHSAKLCLEFPSLLGTLLYYIHQEYKYITVCSLEVYSSGPILKCNLYSSPHQLHYPNYAIFVAMLF